VARSSSQLDNTRRSLRRKRFREVESEADRVRDCLSTGFWTRSARMPLYM
jgi:hypothetical protein